jgi:RimJ/RimL family protein N-acetyltransferase
VRQISDPTTIPPLFQRLPYNLVPAAVAAGIARGRFFATDSAIDGTQPALAVLWDDAHGLYLAGDFALADEAARRDVADLLRAEVFPTAKAPGLILFADASASGDVLAMLLPERRLIPDQRVIFRLEAHRPVPSASLDGYVLEPVDATFFRRTDLTGRESLDEWLADCWLSLDAFAAAGFGVAARSAAEVVGWCMAEYVGAGECGIGIETATDHRGRGLGTTLARAFIEQAAERDLIARWDSWARNRPSVAIAERLGFAERTQYPVHWVPVGVAGKQAE